MKAILQHRILMLVMSFALIVITIASCDDDDAPKTVPEVTTAAISNIATTSATGGGNIVSDGNDEIIAKGLVYSSTDAIPTIEDDKTNAIGSSVSFTSELDGLTSGTIYHVRAYATNGVGTSYGAVVVFTTGNAAPVATNITIDGDLEINAQLTASYTYNDAEGDTQSGTTFQWYSATDGAGAGETAIPGATTSSYTIVPTDEFKYIRVGIIPKALGGTTTGIEAKSPFIGPVPEAPEMVTFTYNGQSVTYGVIVSTITGRKWFDRNIGASRVAQTLDDFHAYGDLFQWGRPSDGHQLISWTSSVAGSPVNGTTMTKFTTDSPNSALFYINAVSGPFDWRDPQKEDLLQVNNPCPNGWRLPTNTEWNLELQTSSTGGMVLISEAFSKLKLTAAGFRTFYSGDLAVGTDGPGSWGYYWSSSITSAGFGDVVTFVTSQTAGSSLTDAHRATGYACRCIKNE